MASEPFYTLPSGERVPASEATPEQRAQAIAYMLHTSGYSPYVVARSYYAAGGRGGLWKTNFGQKLLQSKELAEVKEALSRIEKIKALLAKKAKERAKYELMTFGKITPETLQKMKASGTEFSLFQPAAGNVSGDEIATLLKATQAKISDITKTSKLSSAVEKVGDLAYVSNKLAQKYSSAVSEYNLAVQEYESLVKQINELYAKWEKKYGSGKALDEIQYSIAMAELEKIKSLSEKAAQLETQLQQKEAKLQSLQQKVSTTLKTAKGLSEFETESYRKWIAPQMALISLYKKGEITTEQAIQSGIVEVPSSFGGRVGLGTQMASEKIEDFLGVSPRRNTAPKWMPKPLIEYGTGFAATALLALPSTVGFVARAVETKGASVPGEVSETISMAITRPYYFAGSVVGGWFAGKAITKGLDIASKIPAKIRLAEKKVGVVHSYNIGKYTAGEDITLLSKRQYTIKTLTTSRDVYARMRLPALASKTTVNTGSEILMKMKGIKFKFVNKAISKKPLDFTIRRFLSKTDFSRKYTVESKFFPSRFVKVAPSGYSQLIGKGQSKTYFSSTYVSSIVEMTKDNVYLTKPVSGIGRIAGQINQYGKSFPKGSFINLRALRSGATSTTAISIKMPLSTRYISLFKFKATDVGSFGSQSGTGIGIAFSRVTGKISRLGPTGLEKIPVVETRIIGLSLVKDWNSGRGVVRLFTHYTKGAVRSYEPVRGAGRILNPSLFVSKKFIGGGSGVLGKIKITTEPTVSQGSRTLSLKTIFLSEKLEKPPSINVTP